MQRVMAEGIEVRIEDGYPADRSTDFLRGPDRHRGALMLWRKALHHVAAAADIDRHFTAGFILDDGRMAMTADGADGSVVCINPDRFREAIKKYGKEPLSLAAFLHGVACHELAHLDGRMGNGHDEEFIAAREDLGASTAHTIPQIAELAACTLGLGPCNVEPTKYEAARQEAIRACEPAVTGQEASWTSGDLCQAAADPLAPMVASFVDHLLELRPGGLSRDYIEGFAVRQGARLRATVAGLSAGRTPCSLQIAEKCGRDEHPSPSSVYQHVTATSIPAAKTVTVGSADASGKLSNRAFHAAGTAAYWWLRDDTAGEFVELGARYRGDRDFEVSLDLVIGHDYTIGAGRGSDAVRGEFTILP